LTQGGILWFNEKDLRDIIIIDPQWLTKTFATVVSLKKGFVKVNQVELLSALFFSPHSVFLSGWSVEYQSLADDLEAANLSA